jgi:hypothetical protein
MPCSELHLMSKESAVPNALKPVSLRVAPDRSLQCKSNKNNKNETRLTTTCCMLRMFSGCIFATWALRSAAMLLETICLC